MPARPTIRPATSGYARLTQADEEDALTGYLDEDVDDEDPYHPRTPRTVSMSAPLYEPIQPGTQGAMSLPNSAGGPRRPRRTRPRRSSSGGVDIKAINARLERWADEITARFKIHKVKGKSHEEERLEIHHTVFQPPEGVRPLSAEQLHSDAWLHPPGRMTKAEYDATVESVRTAIEMGVHPQMISQGSSGSYFARNTDGKVVGVFKPKDEEPYASRNPKWTKWIHRNLFPCFFGRACLIPNLSYVSEAAAYTLDLRLQTGIVPPTDVVHMSSKAFYYDIWQRSAYYRGRKPLPEKPGSFQVFLKGFKDATKFLQENPWPDDTLTGFRPGSNQRQRGWGKHCNPNMQMDDEDVQPEAQPINRADGARSPQPDAFAWTDAIQQSFREELEKLVILDYLMRNTDRGLDNWMVKIDQETQKATIVSEPMHMNTNVMDDDEDYDHPMPVTSENRHLQNPYRLQEAMQPSRSGTPSGSRNRPILSPDVHIGAIDNSLSWPWKHPDAWRSFPFGWLFLPVSLIGQPFSQKTRDHFLPLLTSTDWWTGTQIALRQIFEQDDDFKERMFARQMAVMKGQAWNVVETLKIEDHGPLELTRRSRVCVWDDLVDIPVAIPLRTPPANVHSHRRGESYMSESSDMVEEEMDISAANGPIKPRDDLLSFDAAPPGELPNPNRFSLSHESADGDMANPFGEPLTPASTSGELHGRSNTRDFASRMNPRPLPLRSTTRTSLEAGGSGGAGAGARHRPSGSRGRFSFSSRHGTTLFYDDIDEGDLGYAAARVTEKHTRKVIVERLETVKGQNPFFTWC